VGKSRKGKGPSAERKKREKVRKRKHFTKKGGGKKTKNECPHPFKNVFPSDSFLLGDGGREKLPPAKERRPSLGKQYSRRVGDRVSAKEETIRIPICSFETTKITHLT